MGRRKKPASEKLVSVGLYIHPKDETELKEIADKEDRERGYVTRALYLRGVSAYQRDGLLIEPERPHNVIYMPAEEYAAMKRELATYRKRAKRSPARSSSR
jgi:hypothetical protein